MYDYCTHFMLHLENIRPKYQPSSNLLRTYASEAGTCDRQLFYRLMHRPSNVDPETLPPPEASTVAFEIGNYLHDQYQRMMQRLHPETFTGEVKWKYPEPPADPVVSGRCDGVFTDPETGQKVALEIKTMSAWKYNKAVSAGLPYTSNSLQAAESMYILKCDMVQVVYICKEWVKPGVRPIHIWTYNVRPDVVIAELNRKDRILNIAKKGGPVPLRMIRGRPITNIEKDDECKWCDFSDLCAIDGAGEMK